MLKSLLLAIAVFEMMSTVAAYAATCTSTTRDQPVNSPASGPVTNSGKMAGQG